MLADVSRPTYWWVWGWMPPSGNMVGYIQADIKAVAEYCSFQLLTRRYNYILWQSRIWIFDQMREQIIHQWARGVPGPQVPRLIPGPDGPGSK